MADTRKDKRAPVSLKVRFKSATVDEFIEQYSRDISKGGIFIKSKSPMAIGTLLKFEFQLKDESRLIQGVGRVVWKREAADATTDERPPGMGIKFIKMDPESRSTVEKILSNREASTATFEVGAQEAGVRLSVAPAQGSLPAPSKGSVPPRTLPGVGLPANTNVSEIPLKRGVEESPFFPSTDGGDAPLPEDSTQIRHASEFLASALSAADDDAAQEAARNAEAARKRAEEIDRSRAEQAAREKAERDAAWEAQRAEQERIVLEAMRAANQARGGYVSGPPDSRTSQRPDRLSQRPEENVAQILAEHATEEGTSTESEREQAAKEALARQSWERRSNAPTPRSGRRSSNPPAPSTSATRGPRISRDETTSRPPPPAPAGSSKVVPILLLVATAATGAFFIWKSQTPTEQITSAENEDTAAEAVDRDPPTVNPSEAEATAAANPTPAAPTTAPPAPVSPTIVEPTPATVQTAAFRVETQPPGATIWVGSEQRGASPQDLSLPIGEPITVRARLAGYAETVREVVPGPGLDRVRLALDPLEYILEVETSPSGARVTVGSRSIVSPGRVRLGRSPRWPLRLNATKGGFVPSEQQLEANAFAEVEGTMLHRASFALVPVPAEPAAVATSEHGGRRRPPRGEPSETQSSEPRESNTAAQSERPRESPPPEEIPENPF